MIGRSSNASERGPPRPTRSSSLFQCTPPSPPHTHTSDGHPPNSFCLMAVHPKATPGCRNSTEQPSWLAILHTCSYLVSCNLGRSRLTSTNRGGCMTSRFDGLKAKVFLIANALMSNFCENTQCFCIHSDDWMSITSAIISGTPPETASFHSCLRSPHPILQKSRGSSRTVAGNWADALTFLPTCS